jgi:HlyD family type I secretion membrane fusion protein
MRLPALISGWNVPTIYKKPEAKVPAPRGLPTEAMPVVWLGNIIFLLFFGVLGTWAAFAPLAGAVIAPGVIKVQGSNKAVQHLDGGIVREILVKDGDEVEQGQLLLRLDDVQPRAAVQQLRSSYYSLLALSSRLKAERDGLAKIELPPELAQRQNEPEVAEIIAGQQNLFEGRKKTIEGQTSVLKQRVLQLREQGRGAEIQQKSQDTQLGLINDQLKGTRYLYEQGYAPRTRVLELERTAAQLIGTKGEYGTTLARIQQSVGETELQMLQLQKERMAEVSTQLTDTTDRLTGTAERLRAAEDILNRTDIRAPASGIVLGMTASTVGGIVDRGARILEIVPVTQPMIIDASVKVDDIEGLREGLPAEVRLTAYKQREVGIIHGKVTKVSADRTTKPQESTPHYSITVELDDEWKSMKGVRLVPGMPATVTVATRERTVLEYMVGPFTDFLASSMREK